MTKNKNFYQSSHLLSAEELEQINIFSLKILAEIGVDIEDEVLEAKLVKNGCQLKNGRLIFPGQYIEEVIERQIEFQETNVNPALRFKNPLSGAEKRLAAGKLYSQPFGTVARILDLDSFRPRSVREEDLLDLIQLQNTLKNIDFTGASVIPGDYPAKIRELLMVEKALRYSSKVYGGIAVSRSSEVDYIIELYRIVQNSQPEPIAGLGISPESPLSYPKEITDIMEKVARAGIPIKILVAPIAGLTSPLTIAGSLAQLNASMLAFMAILAITGSQTLVLFCSRLSFPNMRKGYSIWGLPEIGLASASAVQLASYYNLPSIVYGPSTTSCNIDVQAGYEKAINALLPALAGANVLSGAGSLASNTLASKVQLVIDNEIITLVKKIVKNYKANPETLALEVIKEGIEEGNFIANSHTVKHLRAGEIYHSDLGFASFWHEWENEGFPQLADKAKEKIKDILQVKAEQLLSAEQDKAFKKVLSQAEKNLF